MDKKQAANSNNRFISVVSVRRYPRRYQF